MNKLGNKKTVGDIVRKYLSEFPAWYPSNSLARIIYNENKHSFEDPEQARNLIKYYKGKHGDISRGKLAVTDFIEKEKKSSSKFAQPPTLAKEKTNFEIPAGYKKVGFISDLQVPFHDPKAIDICFNYLTKYGIDCLFINGDLVDFYAISEYVKDPRERDFSGEYESIIEMLLYIKQTFNSIPIYYNLDANHEMRWDKYMAGKAPELLGLKLFSIEDLLKLDDIGIHYIKDVHTVKIGKLPAIHGDTTFRRGGGVFPARTLWNRVKTSCIASHVHRTSEYSNKNMFDEVVTTWTTGMLMHPNVEYAKHVDEYNQGFAIINKEMNGDYEVLNKRIIKDKVR